MNKCHEWMVTYTGRRLYPSKPNPGDIDIVDIAHGLSMICRFGGHVKRFYSVAQHSVIVSEILSGQNARVRFTGLMHDATEAFAGDIIRPLKVQLPDFNGVEETLWAAICKRFDIYPKEGEMEAVKLADNIALMTERRDLTNGNHFRWIDDLEKIVPMERKIEPLSPAEAELQFLKTFEKLYES